MSNNRASLLCLLMALILLGWGALTARAEDAPTVPLEEALTVTDVVIDKTDKNAVTARDLAIIEAQRVAFQKLAERSMTPEVFKSYIMPDDKTVVTLVQDFEIKQEQISANRYVARFTVRFNPEAVDYIKSGGGSISNAPVAPQPAVAEKAPAIPTAPTARLVLVLPYLQTISGKNILWEDHNPWREAWQALGNSKPSANLTVTVPVGDIADVSSGSAEAVWAQDFTVIEKLRANYKASEVVLAVANKSGVSVRVDIYRYRNGELEGKQSLTPYAQGKDDKELYRQIIPQVITEIQTAALWPALPAPPAKDNFEEMTMPVQPAMTALPPPEQPMELPPEKVTLDTTMDFGNFMQWLEVQKRLSSLSPPVMVEISSLNKNAARFTMTATVQGGLEALKKALEKKGLALNRPAVVVDESAIDKDKPPTPQPPYTLQMN